MLGCLIGSILCKQPQLMRDPLCSCSVLSRGFQKRHCDKCPWHVFLLAFDFFKQFFLRSEDSKQNSKPEHCVLPRELSSRSYRLGSLEKHPHLHLLLIESSTHSSLLMQYCRCLHSSCVHVHTSIHASRHISDIRYASHQGKLECYGKS